MVDEIAAAGGEAVANTDSVTSFAGAKAIVDQAVSTYGDLHVVVNNAGILRDRMLVSMSEQEFDDVIAVHLKGTFNVTRHAADVWRAAAKAGTVTDRALVNASSGAGSHGNVGQTNYSAAKAGIAAMTVVNAMSSTATGTGQLHRPRRPDPAHDADARAWASRCSSTCSIPRTCRRSSPCWRRYLSLQRPGLQRVRGVGRDLRRVVDRRLSRDRRPWTAESLAAAMDKLPRRVEVNSQIAQLDEAHGRSGRRP